MNAAHGLAMPNCEPILKNAAATKSLQSRKLRLVRARIAVRVRLAWSIATGTFHLASCHARLAAAIHRFRAGAEEGLTQEKVAELYDALVKNVESLAKYRETAMLLELPLVVMTRTALLMRTYLEDVAVAAAAEGLLASLDSCEPDSSAECLFVHAN